MPAHKLYCYVDESGQDTEGRLFVVSVVITGPQRDQALTLCERIEAETGKGRVKWVRTSYERRLAYIERVLSEPLLQGSLYASISYDTRAYLSFTVETIAWAIDASTNQPYKATVLIDGLPRSHEREVGSALRRLNIKTFKVRGIRKDENDALIRLADGVCGLVRAAVEGQVEMREVFEQARQKGHLVEHEAK